jgi:holo-[acyl-carrier protein] synthase
MIVGTGVDLAEVPRIRASIERFGARFVDRIYTAAEIAYVERKANKYERYAARFAAKEAGTGSGGRISRWPTCAPAGRRCGCMGWRRASRRSWGCATFRSR